MDRLSRDVSLLILAQLPPREIASTVRRLSRYWSSLSKDLYLWKKLCYASHSCVTHLDRYFVDHEMNTPSWWEWLWRCLNVNRETSSGVGYLKESSKIRAGNIAQGRINGFGFIAETMEVIIGCWDTTYTTGHFRVIFANGEMYEGEVQHGLYHGFGTYTWPNETIREGQWEKNILPGYHIIKGPTVMYNRYPPKNSGDPHLTFFHNLDDNSYFLGDYTAGDYCGIGRICFSDGTSYTGSFASGCRSGFGIATDPEGNLYPGRWENDVPIDFAFPKETSAGYWNGVLSKPVSEINSIMRAYLRES